MPIDHTQKRRGRYRVSRFSTDPARQLLDNSSLDLRLRGQSRNELHSRPEWRNWQTRQLEGLVGFFLVQVQILSPAFFYDIFRIQGLSRATPIGMGTAA